MNEMELSDFHLWMCRQIKKKLDEHSHSFSNGYHEFSKKEVITLALSEMLLRLNSIEQE